MIEDRIYYYTPEFAVLVDALCTQVNKVVQKNGLTEDWEELCEYVGDSNGSPLSNAHQVIRRFYSSDGLARMILRVCSPSEQRREEIAFIATRVDHLRESSGITRLNQSYLAVLTLSTIELAEYCEFDGQYRRGGVLREEVAASIQKNKIPSALDSCSRQFIETIAEMLPLRRMLCDILMHAIDAVAKEVEDTESIARNVLAADAHMRAESFYLELASQYKRAPIIGIQNVRIARVDDYYTLADHRRQLRPALIVGQLRSTLVSRVAIEVGLADALHYFSTPGVFPKLSNLVLFDSANTRYRISPEVHSLYSV